MPVHTTKKVFSPERHFVVPAELRAAAQREVARARTSRSLFARIRETLGRTALPEILRPRYASRAAYYKHCKAALSRALTPYWQGSHAALKARVREILHPRRRDVSLLGGLLRATVTPAALAIFMLAATAEVAHADRYCTVSFTEESGFQNPFEGVDIGNRSYPSFADLDGDGDQDALVGEIAGSLKYYKNTGTPVAPVFVEQVDAANPFNGVDVGYNSAPALTDLDGDGDLDAVVGARDGNLKYFQNTGAPDAPAFAEQTGTTNPFDEVDVGDYSTPTLADLDGDSDLDAVVGEADGTLNYFMNSGTELAPVFTEQTGSASPFEGADVGSYSSPSLGDLDGDGDLDVVVGNVVGTFKYFENSGTALAPAFAEQTGLANPFDGVDVGTRSAPTLGDLDNDGDLDALIGEQTGILKYLKNIGTTLAPAFASQTGFVNPFGGVDIGLLGSPAFADLDGDGDQDAIVGESGGALRYFLNTGTSLAPNYVEQTDAANPFDGVDVGSWCVPAFADLDGDGDQDVLLGEINGALYYYKNMGTALAPNFVEQTGAANPFDGVDLGAYSTPALADLDGDGDHDVLIGNFGGTLRYFENTGTALGPVFAEQTGTNNPFNGVPLSGYNKPAFADLDGDGDLDVLTSNFGGNLRFYRNTGTALSPAFVEDQNENPLAEVEYVYDNRSAHSFADLDGDADLDVLIGIQDGTFRYFKNGSVPLSPSFTQQTGAANPFDGLDVGYRVNPAFVDLDGDGDQDAVNGQENGQGLKYFKNTGTAVAPIFVEQTGTDNPFDGVVTGSSLTLAFSDLDADGDRDVIVGVSYGALRYFKNTGTALAPVFVEQAPFFNPFDGVDVGSSSSAAFADLDGDGDQDALIGEQAGSLNYFKNTGTLLAPDFAEQTGAANPFDGVDVGYLSRPAFADLDMDGDLDATIGNSQGTLIYLKNTGSALFPSFTPETGADNPFNGVDVGNRSVPAFADLDGDGNLDVLLGNNLSTVNYFLGDTVDTTPPVITLSGGADVTVECGGTYVELGATASDDCQGPVSVTVGGDIVDTASPGEYTITYDASDGTNAATQLTRTVTVEDATGPDISLNGDSELTIECGATYTEEGATATDACAGPVEVSVGGDVVDTSNPGQYFIVYEASDGTNAGNPVHRLMTVEDTTGPEITLNGDEEVTVECGGTYAEEGATANDACAGAVDVSVGGDIVDTSNPGQYFIVYEASDGTNAGNPVYRLVTVEDTSGPEITLNGDAEVTVECGGTYTEEGATASDACHGPVSVSIGGDAVLTYVPGEYPITYEATDGVNVTTVTRIVTVQDSGPVITLNGEASITVDCDSTYIDEGATASDLCEGSANLPVSAGGDSVDTSTPGEYTVTYDATDGAGNAAVQVTRTVTVLDNCLTCDDILVNGNFSSGLDGWDVEAGGIATSFDAQTAHLVFSRGGTAGTQSIELSQTLTIPVAVSGTLTFVVSNLNQGAQVAGGLSLVLDGISQGTIDQADIPYATFPLSFDLSPYADGNEHTVAFSYSVNADANGGPLFELYNVELVICRPESEGEGALEGEGVVEGEGAAEGIADGEGTTEGEGVAEGIADGEGTTEGEGVTEGAADGEGASEGEGTTEGATEGEGQQEGETDGEGEGEGSANAIYEQLLQIFATAESSGNNTLTLTEIQSVLPGFTLQDLDAADTNLDGELSVAELLQRVGGGILSHADTSGDSIVQLSELLRLIQLYNAGRYACAENAGATEDGFALTAPPSEPACVLHSVDQNGDKVITLSELLRGIQLYSLGGYTWCPGEGTEDGFCG